MIFVNYFRSIVGAYSSEVLKVEHDNPCHSLQPNPDGSGKLVCPNNLSSSFKSVSSFRCSKYPCWSTSHNVYDDETYSDSDEENFIPQKRQQTKYYNSWYRYYD